MPHCKAPVSSHLPLKTFPKLPEPSSVPAYTQSVVKTCVTVVAHLSSARQTQHHNPHCVLNREMLLLNLLPTRKAHAAGVWLGREVLTKPARPKKIKI